MNDTPLRDRARTIRAGTAIALTAMLLAGVAVAGASEHGDDMKNMEAAAGRVWYEKHCTPCHGPGGGPGSAVRATDGTAVDLRDYVARNGGRFPAPKWIAVVEQLDLRSPHADVWDNIRRAQAGTSGQAAAARGIVLIIAEYVLSVQTK